MNLATPGAAACLGLSLAIVAVQIVIAQLRRYRFGPLEWVWRSLVYMQRQPMRN